MSILICFGLVLNDVPLILRIQRDEKDLLDLRNAGVGNAHPGQVGSFHIYSAHVSEDGMLILTTDYELKNAMGLVHSPNKGFPRNRLRHLYGGWYRYWE